MCTQCARESLFWAVLSKWLYCEVLLLQVGREELVAFIRNDALGLDHLKTSQTYYPDIKMWLDAAFKENVS